MRLIILQTGRDGYLKYACDDIEYTCWIDAIHHDWIEKNARYKAGETINFIKANNRYNEREI